MDIPRWWARVPSFVAVMGVVAALQTGCGAPCQASPSLPQTPPMGWNSWNSGIELTEQSVKATIDAMVSSGMRDAGYRYVNLDAGWAVPQRGPHGELRPDPGRFPDGIAGVARYAHERDMRFGLYASPYGEDCGTQPALGSAGHETLDAQTFAGWGVDYLKYDWCHDAADHQQQVQVFSRMRDALRATGRPMVYSINPNSSDDHTAGARYDWSGIADTVRAAGDLAPVWRDNLAQLGTFDPFVTGDFLGVPDEFAAAASVVAPSRPGYWTDADMLVVGVQWTDFATLLFQRMRDQLAAGDLPAEEIERLRQVTGMSEDQVRRVLAAEPNLTDTEQRSHLSLWAMLSAPLIVGNDVRTMTPQTRDMLINREVISIDQDPRMAPARPLPADPRVLVKPLSDGSVAVGLFNSSDGPVSIATTTADVGLTGSFCYSVRDLWAHTEAMTTGAIDGGTVGPHAITLLRVVSSCG